MAQANKNALKKELERKLEKENLEKKLRREREEQRIRNLQKKKVPPLSRNALASGLTKLNVPTLMPLRDAIMSLSDPSFLNKKFNQDVYSELPQRVKDFIGLAPNQITRAVIISKIIEGVGRAKENKKKVNVATMTNNNNLNKASLNVINEIEKAKKRNNSMSRNMPVPPPPPPPKVAPPPPPPPPPPKVAPPPPPPPPPPKVAPPPPPPPPPPKVAPPPLKISENAAKKGLAKNAAEGAAQGAKNRQIRLIRNKLNKLKNNNLTSEFNKILAGNPNINTLLEFNSRLNSQGEKKNNQ